jgi:hypothetical protein
VAEALRKAGCFPDEIPGDAFGGDIVAAGWWAQYRGGSGPHPADHAKRLFVGFGETPDEAFAELAQRHAE